MHAMLFPRQFASAPPATTDFHFSRIFRGDKQATALSRHEHYLFSSLSLKSGMNVLHVGCGSGRVTLELARFESVTIVGIDPDPLKIKCAEDTAKQSGLEARVKFMQGQPNDLQRLFKPGTFDAIFAIEETKVAPSFRHIYEQFAYVLKPEGKIAVYEWCWTTEFDVRNSDHCRLAELLEDITGIGHRHPSERTFKSAIAALMSPPFELISSEDLAITEKPVLPWYSPLEKALVDSRAVWASENRSQGMFGNITKPAAAVLLQAGRSKLVTPMAFFVAKRCQGGTP